MKPNNLPSEVYTEKFKDTYNHRQLGVIEGRLTSSITEEESISPPSEDRMLAFCTPISPNCVTCTNNLMCTGALGSFNLLNTAVITSQKDCRSNTNRNSNAPCDSVIQDLSQYTGSYVQWVYSGTSISWWSAKFPVSTTVQTMTLFNVVYAN